MFDAIEDSQGALWLATPAGLSVVRGKQFQNVIAGGPLLIDFVVTLSEGQDGAIWAGTYGKGLWRVKGRRAPPIHHMPTASPATRSVRSMRIRKARFGSAPSAAG